METNTPVVRNVAMKRIFLTVAMVAWCGALSGRAPGQAPSRPAIEEIPLGLADVPTKEPRPATGPAPDQQWKIQRDQDDKAPLASFIDSLRGNDAALEIVLGQGKLLTLKRPIAVGPHDPSIAVGHPGVIYVEVLPNPQLLRVTGLRAGVTDLSVTTGDGQTFSFEVRVTYDLELLRAQLAQVFPDARLRLAQIREHLVVEGQARSPLQVTQILATIQGYLQSMQANRVVQGTTSGGGAAPPPAAPAAGGEQPGAEGAQQPQAPPTLQAEAATGASGAGTATGAAPQIVNLIVVPGVHQVLLKVRVAELNRTAVRSIGSDIMGVSPTSGNMIGTLLGNGIGTATGTSAAAGLAGAFTETQSANTTAFGIFPSGDWLIFFQALRRHQLLNILAEPNLMAMSGHEASFLAGGQFPVPVPQGLGTVAIQFQNFGVQLNFVPTVLDEERIRLTVTPDVSALDNTIGTAIAGTVVPGISQRRATTTVELRQGETLAIAGLLQVSIAANSGRLPLLGDLPYIGPLFSNSTNQRQEKELVVSVSPFLVQPMQCDQVPPGPGALVKEPNDLEFYLLNRLEGRTGRDYHSTTNWDDYKMLKLQRKYMKGPLGHCE